MKRRLKRRKDYGKDFPQSCRIWDLLHQLFNQVYKEKPPPDFLESNSPYFLAIHFVVCPVKTLTSYILKMLPKECCQHFDANPGAYIICGMLTWSTKHTAVTKHSSVLYYLWYVMCNMISGCDRAWMKILSKSTWECLRVNLTWPEKELVWSRNLT